MNARTATPTADRQVACAACHLAHDPGAIIDGELQELGACEAGNAYLDWGCPCGATLRRRDVERAMGAVG